MGNKMPATGKIKEKILNPAILVTLLFLFGTPAQANVTASPSNVNFGNQAVGTTSAPIAVKLSNNGKHRATISSASLSGAQFFYSGPSLPITLNSGGSLTVSVTFSPVAAQSYACTLVFTRGNGSTIMVALSGNGVSAPTLAQPPVISSQPVSKTVIAGQTATFTVAAPGTAPMMYQWKKNGTTISGAMSSTYTTPPETTSDSGAQFSVTVSNSTGYAASTAATLTVNAATLILNSSSTVLNFGNVNLSTSGSQTVTLTNAGNSNITISNVSVSGAGFYASGISTGLILNPGQAATLTATFTPAATGSVTGQATVASNASNSPDTIALSGAGLAQVNHSVILSWTPSTSAVTGYYSYSSTKSGGPYTKLSATPVQTTTYTDFTVQAGQTYFYVVTSVDARSVESAYSVEISASVP